MASEGNVAVDGEVAVDGDLAAGARSQGDGVPVKLNACPVWGLQMNSVWGDGQMDNFGLVVNGDRRRDALIRHPQGWGISGR